MKGKDRGECFERVANSSGTENYCSSCDDEGRLECRILRLIYVPRNELRVLIDPMLHRRTDPPAFRAVQGSMEGAS